MKPLRPRQHTGQGTPRRLPVRTVSPVLRDLYEALEEAGYSQRSVAEAIGTVSSSLTHWKAGTAAPTLLMAETFAQVLGYRLVLEKVEEGASTASDFASNVA